MKGIKDFWKQTLIQIAPNFPEKNFTLIRKYMYVYLLTLK